MSDKPVSFIPAHGGYSNLLSYAKAQIIYDATVCFCDRFLTKGDRTRDQMIQAARSGKQNIVEGSMLSGASKEMEIRLTCVARASLEELLTDYHDFLRTKNATVWAKDSKEATYVSKLSRKATPTTNEKTNGTHATNAAVAGHGSQVSPWSHNPYDLFRPIVETRPPEVVANIVVCLIHQASYLLDRQICQLEEAFITNGGMREAMTRARLAYRDTHRSRRLR